MLQRRGRLLRTHFPPPHRSSLCLTGGWSATADSSRFQTQISPRNSDCISEKSSCLTTSWWYVVPHGFMADSCYAGRPGYVPACGELPSQVWGGGDGVELAQAFGLPGAGSNTDRYHWKWGFVGFCKRPEGDLEPQPWLLQRLKHESRTPFDRLHGSAVQAPPLGGLPSWAGFSLGGKVGLGSSRLSFVSSATSRILFLKIPATVLLFPVPEPQLVMGPGRCGAV